MELTTLADYRVIMLCPLSPRRTIDPISPFGRSLAQSLDSEGLTTLQVEWSDDVVAVCAARDIERLARLQEEVIEKRRGVPFCCCNNFLGLLNGSTGIHHFSSTLIAAMKDDHHCTACLLQPSSERIPL